jgi:hypothetical protein
VGAPSKGARQNGELFFRYGTCLRLVGEFFTDNPLLSEERKSCNPDNEQ